VGTVATQREQSTTQVDVTNRKAAPLGRLQTGDSAGHSTTVVDERGRDRSRMSETMPHPIKA